MVSLSMRRWRPRTAGFLIGGLMLILVALVASYALSNFQPKTEVRLGSGVFKARLAITPDERIQGLSGVKKLAANEGLLMVYAKPEKTGIWMKDMDIAIDIIWLDSAKKVVHIVMNASPDIGTSKTFLPTSPAMYVFEVPAGTVKKSAIKLGDVASFAVPEATL
jgi:uncharacterized membrane protein (UPF0127 family)